MRKILLNIHPAGRMTDISLGTIEERMAMVPDWKPELHDARVSDALYVNVVMQLPAIGADEIRRLREVFDNMPRMRTRVWRDYGKEVPLDEADAAMLEAAADAFGKAQG